MVKKSQVVSKISTLLHSLAPHWGKSGHAENTPAKTFIHEQAFNHLTWTDITNPTRKELQLLADQYDIHPLHLQACLSKGQLDRIEFEDNYLFILLHVPKYSKKDNKMVTMRLCCFLGRKFLITVHKGAVDELTLLFNELENDPKRQAEVFKKSAGHILHEVLTKLIADVSSVHKSLLKELDDIEDLVFDVNVSGVYEITQLRQKIIRLKRVISPLKVIVQALADDTSELTPALTRQFNYLANELNKLRELLDDAKEVIEIYKDADFTVSTERTNKILGILTIIFTLAIPAQVLGSFFGMNVYVPGGVESGPFTLFGKFTSFYLILVGAVIPAVLMLLYFKKKKWF